MVDVTNRANGGPREGARIDPEVSARFLLTMADGLWFNSGNYPADVVLLFYGKTGFLGEDLNREERISGTRGSQGVYLCLPDNQEAR